MPLVPALERLMQAGRSLQVFLTEQQLQRASGQVMLGQRSVRVERHRVSGKVAGFRHEEACLVPSALDRFGVQDKSVGPGVNVPQKALHCDSGILPTIADSYWVLNLELVPQGGSPETFTTAQP